MKLIERFFEIMFEVIGWIRIFISPFLIGLITGAIIYFRDKNILTLTIGLTLVVAGGVIGAIWATREWKNKGTIDFISRIMRNPELHDEEKSSTKK